MRNTYCKQRRKERDAQLKIDYENLILTGMGKMEVIEYLMHKYSIFAVQTIYNILNRTK